MSEIQERDPQAFWSECQKDCDDMGYETLKEEDNWFIDDNCYCRDKNKSVMIW